jgi:ATP-dependent RNA helicase DDX18/HAS1
LIIGGSNKKEEAIKLQKGSNIIVATPGRLLDHLLTTERLTLDNLKMLILDEADSIMKNGFEKEVN